MARGARGAPSEDQQRERGRDRGAGWRLGLGIKESGGLYQSELTALCGSVRRHDRADLGQIDQFEDDVDRGGCDDKFAVFLTRLEPPLSYRISRSLVETIPSDCLTWIG